MKKNILGLTLIMSLSHLFSQNDSINRIDSDERKIGYWVKYLDLNFLPADSIDAYFYCYVYYDNGRAIFTLGKDWQVKRLSIRPENKYLIKGRPVLLNGAIRRYDGIDTLAKTIEIYENGYPVTLTSYHHCQYHKYGISEFLDFTKTYDNQKGSYYFEYHDAFQTTIKKYWYRRENGRWKKHRIKD